MLVDEEHAPGAPRRVVQPEKAVDVGGAGVDDAVGVLAERLLTFLLQLALGLVGLPGGGGVGGLAHHAVDVADVLFNHLVKAAAAEAVGAEIAGVEHRLAAGLDEEGVGVEGRVVDVDGLDFERSQLERPRRDERVGLLELFGQQAVALALRASGVHHVLGLDGHYVDGHLAHVDGDGVVELVDARDVVGVIVGDEQGAARQVAVV